MNQISHPAAAIPPLPERDLLECARQLHGIAAELDGAHVLVAGAGGFVGGWLVEAILVLAQTARIRLTITALTRSLATYRTAHPHLNHESRLRLVEADLCDPNCLSEVSGVTHVIHAASMVNQQANPAQAIEALDVIGAGTANLARWATRNACRRFLYLSSGAVHGPSSEIPTPTREDAPCGPIVLDETAAYGVGKRLAELLACLHTRNSATETVIARIWSCVGPRLPLRGHFAIGSFVADALAGRPITVTGDGADVRSYLYAGDLAVWLWTLLMRGDAGRPYNVGSDAPITILELARMVDASVGSAGVEVRGSRPAGRPSSHYVPDISQARSSLGLEPRITLDEGIRRMVAWHQAHPNPALL